MPASNRMASFLYTIQWEGRAKLSLDPRDAGNWTGGRVRIGKLLGSRYGVSAAVALAHGWTPATLTQDQALTIFVDDYWTPIGADGLPAGLDHSASDDAYNAGPASAKKRLASVQAMALSTAIALRIHAYAHARLSFLMALRNLWKIDGPGWAKRVAGVEAESLKMAAAALAAASAPVTAPQGAVGFLTPADVPARARETIDHETVGKAAEQARGDSAAELWGVFGATVAGVIAAMLWPEVIYGVIAGAIAFDAHGLWRWHAHRARHQALSMLANELAPEGA